MRTMLYYFTGTGNSFIVARDIARQLRGETVPIASVVDSETITPKADVVGIVFPVYYGNIPMIVERFTRRLTGIEDAYVFAVGTYGGGLGESMKTLTGVLTRNGGTLSARYGVHMPQNAFNKPWEKHARLYKRWKTKVEKITRGVSSQRKGFFVGLSIGHVLTYPIYMGLKPFYKRSFAKLVQSTPDQPIEELIRFMDTTFAVNESCNGCGICVKICPVNNITLENGKPVWHNQCENCIACYNWCPRRAIESGIAQKEYYYRHPETSVSDIMSRKGT